MKRENVAKVFRFLIVVSIILTSSILLFYIWKVTYPFIIAIVFALIMNPLVTFLEKKWKFPRSLAVITTLFLLISVFAALITLLIAEIVDGTAYLSKVVPEQVGILITYLENVFAGQVIPFYNKLASIVNGLDGARQETIMNSITSTGNKITESATKFLQNFFIKLPALISWIPNAATVIIFALLATFFISKDWDKLSHLFTNFLPEKAKVSSRKVFIDLKKALVGFVKAQLTLISITLVIVLVGLLILQVNYAITIALITGLVDLMPYLGTGLIFIPWIIYELVIGNFGLALGLSILYTVVVVQRQVMEPKILSSNIGLNPLSTLVALFVGFKLIGFLGLIVGPVTLVLITTLHKANVFRDLWSYIKGA
ncbi:sporulation integral membrane protein YtvI [Lederbergia lenta]|uniref:Sporulation integral membrane protein YtvI n=1 Tax=Lederbergia lenta TaxID=1467 RepID=A0A2X4VVY2_LEDLE|nr:sporulation integral membrane protein YtvI [Lederbergia lenta]MCM3111129.1 sporulation integral membrane protein YtvI [Lederbergia lenta]MEC2325483.1 sporulation integral membrane protein YtvI [Lederbergia lenta]SQI54973.1 sporulation integral membrane protein YtvI [Lederbergia lenta]